MKGNGNRIYMMVKEYLDGKMVLFIKVSIRIIKEVVLNYNKILEKLVTFVHTSILLRTIKQNKECSGFRHIVNQLEYNPSI